MNGVGGGVRVGVGVGGVGNCCNKTRPKGLFPT